MVQFLEPERQPSGAQPTVVANADMPTNCERPALEEPRMPADSYDYSSLIRLRSETKRESERKLFHFGSTLINTMRTSLSENPFSR
jgi:hypothetical protein